MPSSTSSSDALSTVPVYFTTEKQGARKTAMKILLAGALVFGGIIAVYSGGLGLVESAANAGLHARAKTMMMYIPKLTEVAGDNKTTLVFGSSMVEAGFFPPHFDATLAAQGIASTSFNYGIANLNPAFQKFITRRIREQFELDGKKLSLVLLELTPFQLTTVRVAATAATADQNLAVLADNADLWQQTLQDPARGVRLFTIRYLRRGYSAELVSAIPRLVTQASAFEQYEGYEDAQRTLDAAQARFNSIMATNTDYPRSPLPGWNPLFNGGGFDVSLVTEETRQALREYSRAQAHPVFLRSDLQRRIETSDVLELRFDEGLITDFLTMVRDLQAVSEHIEVFLMPRNTEWVSYTPEVQARLDALKRRVTAETGVTVRDFQVQPAIGSEYFRDTTHLDAEGILLFTDFLAEEYGEMLQAGHK